MSFRMNTVQALGSMVSGSEHITWFKHFAPVKRAEGDAQKRASDFAKCFIGFCAIYRWSKRRYISDLSNTRSPIILSLSNICIKQKAPLLQDSVYLKDICLDQISTENRIKVFYETYAKHHLLGWVLGWTSVQALGLLVSVNWTHYCAYISDLSNS